MVIIGYHCVSFSAAFLDFCVKLSSGLQKRGTPSFLFVLERVPNRNAFLHPIHALHGKFVLTSRWGHHLEVAAGWRVLDASPIWEGLIDDIVEGGSDQDINRYILHVDLMLSCSLSISFLLAWNQNKLGGRTSLEVSSNLLLKAWPTSNLDQVA